LLLSVKYKEVCWQLWLALTGLEKIKFCGTGSLNVTSRSGLLKTFGVHRTKEVKGKAIPLQAWTGPAGSRRLRFPDFKTISTERW